MRALKVAVCGAILAGTVAVVGPTPAGAATTAGHASYDLGPKEERLATVSRSTATANAARGAAMAEVTWSPATIVDPQFDVPAANGDITSVRVAVNSEPGVPSMFVAAQVRSWVRPTNPEWVNGVTWLDWIVDVNADDIGDFAVEIVNFEGLLYADVWRISTGAHVCNAIPLFDGTSSSYGAYAPLSCFGNPRAFRVFAAMKYNGGLVDEAPNTTWTPLLSSRIWPAKPGVPVTTAAPASLDVSWAAPSATLWPVTDYVVQFSLASPVSWKNFTDGVSTARTARVTGLKPGVRYIVRVAAKNKLGTGTFTTASVARAPLAAGVLPGAPGQPTGTPGNKSITVRWAYPAKTGSHVITDYQIDTSTNNGATWTRFNDAVTNVRSAVVTGLTPASVIRVRVRAKSFAGVGPWSTMSLPLKPLTTPSAPTSLVGEGVDGAVNLSWTASASNGGAAIDHYRVFYRPAVVRSATVTPRIVGGTPSPISTVPWQVRVRIITPTGFGLCGGTLIDAQWVLTAAHCTSDRTASQFIVHAGISLQTDMNDLNGVRVDKVITHPSFNPDTVENDVALLHLAKVPTGATPIPLYTNAAGPTLGTSALISGWGTTSAGTIPDQLQTAIVDVLADPGEACGLLYGAEFVPATMLCAGHPAGATDTCQGDSGGPLVVEVLGVKFVAGVTSFGRDCGDPDFPGVYARVSTYVPWIQDQIEALWPHVDVSCVGGAPCTSVTINGLANGEGVEVKVRAHNVYGYGASTPIVGPITPGPVIG